MQFGMGLYQTQNSKSSSKSALWQGFWKKWWAFLMHFNKTQFIIRTINNTSPEMHNNIYDYDHGISWKFDCSTERAFHEEII